MSECKGGKAGYFQLAKHKPQSVKFGKEPIDGDYQHANLPAGMLRDFSGENTPRVTVLIFLIILHKSIRVCGFYTDLTLLTRSSCVALQGFDVPLTLLHLSGKGCKCIVLVFRPLTHHAVSIRRDNLFIFFNLFACLAFTCRFLIPFVLYCSFS